MNLAGVYNTIYNNMYMVKINCYYCGKELDVIPSKAKQAKKFCNSICYDKYRTSEEYRRFMSDKGKLQIASEVASGRRDLNKFIYSGVNKVRELAKKGLLKCQTKESQINMANKRFERRKPLGGSKYENIMEAHLLGHNKELVAEYPLDIYNLDFAIPSEKIAIEINTGYWHESKRHKDNDVIKRKLLEKDGWKLYINDCPYCNFTLNYNKICEHCNNGFTTTCKSRKYCSKDCSNKASERKVERTCLTCGKIFYTIPVRIKQGKAKYCSVGCVGGK